MESHRKPNSLIGVLKQYWFYIWFACYILILVAFFVMRYVGMTETRDIINIFPVSFSCLSFGMMHYIIQPAVRNVKNIVKIKHNKHVTPEDNLLWRSKDIEVLLRIAEDGELEKSYAELRELQEYSTAIFVLAIISILYTWILWMMQ